MDLGQIYDPVRHDLDAVSRLLRDHDVDVPVKVFGLPQEFLPHGTRAEILEVAGLTPQVLARQITEAVALRERSGSGLPGAVPGHASGSVRGAVAEG